LLIGGVVWGIGRTREKASSVEREPNDVPAQATLLPMDTHVQGHVGKGASPGQPDMDYFRVPAGKGTRVVSARLAGIPNVDLVLELFDGAGALRAKVDAHGKGAGEWLQPTEIGPGEAFLLVRQLWTQGTPPVDDVADPYDLSVHWGAPQAGWEREPNDEPEQATPVELDRPLRGYLASAEDKDWFVVTAARDGVLIAQVQVAEGIDVVLSTGDAPARAHVAPPGKVAVKGPPNEVKTRVTSGQRVVFGVSRKPLAAKADPKADAVAGLDDPYQFVVTTDPRGPGRWRAGFAVNRPRNPAAPR